MQQVAYIKNKGNDNSRYTLQVPCRQSVKKQINRKLEEINQNPTKLQSCGIYQYNHLMSR